MDGWDYDSCWDQLYPICIKPGVWLPFEYFSLGVEPARLDDRVVYFIVVIIVLPLGHVSFAHILSWGPSFNSFVALMVAFSGHPISCRDCVAQCFLARLLVMKLRQSSLRAVLEQLLLVHTTPHNLQNLYHSYASIFLDTH